VGWGGEVGKGGDSSAPIQDKNNESRGRKLPSHQKDHPDPRQTSVFACQGCSRDFKSRINLYS